MLNNPPKIKGVPQAWIEMTHTLSSLEGEMSEASERLKKSKTRFLNHVKASIEKIEDKEYKINYPEGIADEFKEKIDKIMRSIGRGHKNTIKSMKEAIDELAESELFSDKMVVAVFGIVNSGKSSLGNHLGGNHFEKLKKRFRGQFFIKDDEGEINSVESLPESNTESTKDYQGFQLPGLLWIDCPGIGSLTAKNQLLAERLLSRADYTIFVTSSHQPFSVEEKKSLKKTLKFSGRSSIHGCFIVTQFDVYLEDEDENGEIIKELVMKGDDSREKQSRWCEEQIFNQDDKEEIKLLDFDEPIFCSVSYAKQKLKESRRKGLLHDKWKENWEKNYETSGITSLMKQIQRTVTEKGKEFKETWPTRRKERLKHELEQLVSPALEKLTELREEVIQFRKILQGAESKLKKDIRIKVSVKVIQILKENGIENIKKFNSEKASEELQCSIPKVIIKEIDAHLGELIETYLSDFELNLDDYVDSISPNLSLKNRTEKKKIKISSKGKGIGTAFGGFLLAFGAMLLTGGLAAPIISGLVGGYVGGKIGSKFQSEKTETIIVGTNKDEVISNAQDAYDKYTDQAINVTIKNLNDILCTPMLKAVDANIKSIDDWNCVSS